jgi:Ca2+-binding EF-hand superfamily protein
MRSKIMVNSIGSSGSSANMWSISRSTGSQATSSTEGSRKSPGAELFSKLDSDGSGGLSADELQSFVDAMSSDTRGALLATQEANGSSSSSSSSTTSAADMLSAMDTDGDGSVSESELDTYMKANGPQGGPPPPPPGDAAEGSDPASDLFSAMDADGDGSVTQSELSDFLAAAKTDDTASSDASSSASEASETFDAIDTDQDGSISQAELEAYMKTQAPPPPPPPPQETSDASSITSTSTTTSTSSTSATSSTDTSDELARRLAAALAQFASQAYGRTQSTPDLSSLLSSVA